MTTSSQIDPKITRNIIQVHVNEVVSEAVKCKYLYAHIIEICDLYFEFTTGIVNLFLIFD